MRHALTRRLAASLTLLSLACARMEPPPGGPPDVAPPQLVKTFPDSFQVFRDFDSDVDFVFDEVISEGGSPNQGAGTGDLERLVILSPTREVPRCAGVATGSPSVPMRDGNGTACTGWSFSPASPTCGATASTAAPW